MTALQESEGILIVSEKGRQLGLSTGYISPEGKVEAGLIEFNFPKGAKYSKGFENVYNPFTGKWEGGLSQREVPFYGKGTLGKAYAYERGVQAKLREAWEGRKPLKEYLAPEFRPKQEKTYTFSDVLREQVTQKLMPSYEKLTERKLAGEEKGLRAWELKHFPEWLVGKKLTKENIDKGFFGHTRKGFYNLLREEPAKAVAIAGTLALPTPTKAKLAEQVGLTKFIKSGLGSVKYGVAGTLLPYEVRKPTIKQLRKGGEKLFRLGTTLHEKGLKPSDISLSKQVSQQEKAYQTNKISPLFSWNGHKLQEKSQEYKNFAKKIGYYGARSAYDIGGTILGFGKSALEKPHMALLWAGAGLGAAKIIGKTATTIGFIGYPTLMAPEGQKLRTALEFDECKDAAKDGGEVAGNARKDAEKRIGKSIISDENYLTETENKKKRISNH